MHHWAKQTLLFLLIVFSFFSLSVAFIALTHPQEIIAVLEQFIPKGIPPPLAVRGIGVIGDSLSDEYGADDHRSQLYGSTTLNWVEILAKERHLPFGKWQYWEEPRRQGYAYNFARTSATISSAIEQGQVTGVAELIKAKKINIVVIFIGANDFFPYAPSGYGAIYDGSITDEQTTLKINRMVADETSIIETLQQAGVVHILLVTVPDWGNHIAATVVFPRFDGRERVTNAITTLNTKLAHLAKEKQTALADPNEFYHQVMAREQKGKLTIGGVHMEQLLPSDDPHSLFLDDFIHPGTIYNGLFANYLIEKMNSQLGTSIKPLTEKEIVSVAGL